MQWGSRMPIRVALPKSPHRAAASSPGLGCQTDLAWRRIVMVRRHRRIPLRKSVIEVEGASDTAEISRTIHWVAWLIPLNMLWC